MPNGADDVTKLPSLLTRVLYTLYVLSKFDILRCVNVLSFGWRTWKEVRVCVE